jgi:hypothetical protein
MEKGSLGWADGPEFQSSDGPKLLAARTTTAAARTARRSEGGSGRHFLARSLESVWLGVSVKKVVVVCEL